RYGSFAIVAMPATLPATPRPVKLLLFITLCILLDFYLLPCVFYALVYFTRLRRIGRLEFHGHPNGG
ncbi:MAG: hypothetical protein ACLFSZ_11545, partial [Puniceicoccaceae bacterium]